MLLIRRFSDNTVTFAFHDSHRVEIVDGGLFVDGLVRALDVLPATHEITISEDLPDAYLDGAFTFDGSTWMVANQGVIDQEYARQVAGEQLRMLEAVDGKEKSLKTAGYKHDFGAPWGVHTLQTRDSDDAPWLSVLGAAQAMVFAGQGEQALPPGLQTEANVTIPVTALQAQEIMLSMQQYLASILSTAWSLARQIKAATTLPDLALIDIDGGWPSQQ